jgi:hypothetical protein
LPLTCEKGCVKVRLVASGVGRSRPRLRLSATTRASVQCSRASPRPLWLSARRRRSSRSRPLLDRNDEYSRPSRIEGPPTYRLDDALHVLRG